MSKNENTEKTSEPIKETPDISKSKQRVIPVVPPKERTKINEGKETKNE